jgi:hypothetical protein
MRYSRVVELRCHACGRFATATCPRCEHPVCVKHVPEKELACVECEALWDAGAWKRKIVLAPVAVAAFLLVVGLVFGAIYLVEQSGHEVGPASTGVSILLIAGPIAFAMWVVRRVDRLTFRRKFMRTPSSRLPRSHVVRR